jgi:hypothetical protein
VDLYYYRNALGINAITGLSTYLQHIRATIIKERERHYNVFFVLDITREFYGKANKYELDGPEVKALRRVIAKVKHRWSVIGWVTKNLLFQDPPCFGRHVKHG